MELGVFVVGFGICIGGVGLRIMAPFCVFKKWGFLWVWVFEIGLWIYFWDFNFNVECFNVKKITSKSQKFQKVSNL